MPDPIYISKPLDYEIKDGVMHISAGGQAWCCMSLRTFKTGMRKAQQSIDAYENGSGEVIPIRGRGDH